jgi:hypothetical protein
MASDVIAWLANIFVHVKEKMMRSDKVAERQYLCYKSTELQVQRCTDWSYVGRRRGVMSLKLKDRNIYRTGDCDQSNIGRATQLQPSRLPSLNYETKLRESDFIR